MGAIRHRVADVVSARAALAALAALTSAPPAAAGPQPLALVATGDIGVLPVVTLSVDGRPRRWLIDSGSSHVLVAPGRGAVPRDGADPVPIDSVAGRLPGRAARIALSVGAEAPGDFDAVEVDLRPVLGPLASRVDGVLGLPFLDGRRVAFDLEAGTVDFAAAPSPGGQPLAREGGLPVLSIDLQGRSQRLLVDTGAAGAIVRLRPAGLALHRVQALRLDGNERREVPVIDVPLPALARGLPDGVDGVLGMALLDGCRFTLDLAADRFALHGCARAELPGGFGLQWAVSAGALHVVHVFAGGPAAEAGLRPGDTVVAIDGAPAPPEAADADARLRGRGQVTLTLARDGGTVTATLARRWFLPLLPLPQR